MCGGINCLNARLEDVGIAEVEQFGDSLVLLTRDVTDMRVAEEDSDCIMVVRVFILTHQANFLADLELAEHLNAIAVRKRCYVAAKEMFLVVFDLHSEMILVLFKRKLIFDAKIRQRTDTRSQSY